MTPEQKRAFICELVGDVQESVLASVDKMPEEWDGHELRQYLADRFAGQVIKMSRGEMRRYNNEVITRNL